MHAGVLADLRNPDHERQLAELDIAPFQLVVVNLYPFAETVASGASAEECVEQIDIGGPSMVRAAAKNHANVAVVVSPSGYDAGATRPLRRRRLRPRRSGRSLAGLAFQHTASYDVAVASWFGNVLAPTDVVDGAAHRVPVLGRRDLRARTDVLRYGENPHQRAALYAQPGIDGLAQAEQLHGKQMSYNNYVDTDAALRAAYDFEAPTVAIIKHANPCGIASAETVAEAHLQAHACDPASAFGGVIAVNRPVSVAMAEQVADDLHRGDRRALVRAWRRRDPGRQAVDPRAADRGRRRRRSGLPADLRRSAAADRRHDRGGRRRSATAGPWSPASRPTRRRWPTSSSPGGPAGRSSPTRSCSPPAARRSASAWARSTGSTPAGSRSMRAGDRATGSVAASDAYFPFPDGPEILFEAGVKAVVSPGGSVRDQLTIDGGREGRRHALLHRGPALLPLITPRALR